MWIFFMAIMGLKTQSATIDGLGRRFRICGGISRINGIVTAGAVLKRTLMNLCRPQTFVI